jgi:hypothetical protein
VLTTRQAAPLGSDSSSEPAQTLCRVRTGLVEVERPLKVPVHGREVADCAGRDPQDPPGKGRHRPRHAHAQKAPRKKRLIHCGKRRGHATAPPGGRGQSRDMSAAAALTRPELIAESLPGPKTRKFLAVERRARPYKRAKQNRSTVGNAKGA